MTKAALDIQLSTFIRGYAYNPVKVLVSTGRGDAVYHFN
jgi:hypothetical protein